MSSAAPNQAHYFHDARADRANALWSVVVEDFLAHARTTPERLAALLAADPGHPLGLCAKGFFALLLARCELRQGARDALRDMRLSLSMRGGSRALHHYANALHQAADGRFDRALAIIEMILDDDPDDSFAAKLSHAMRFMIGDAVGMMDSVDCVLARCDPDHAHIGYLMGCRAFALEELGRYGEAERTGRDAVALAPRDAWGVHAVAHVFEMTGQARAGVAWLTSHDGNISHCNNFSGHVFWHLALFRLELGDVSGVLDLYDQRIRADRTDDFRDIANAASLLGRLTIEGAAVGDRWEELADIAERRIHDGSLVFADLHYTLALAGAGRADKAAALAEQLHHSNGSSEQGALARVVGAAMSDAIRAWGGGDHARAARLMMVTRPARQRLGGSHAQRDIFEQITIDALIRSGRKDDARALLGQRLAARTRNRFAEKRLAALTSPRRGALASLGQAAAQIY